MSLAFKYGFLSQKGYKFRFWKTAIRLIKNKETLPWVFGWVLGIVSLLIYLAFQYNPKHHDTIDVFMACALVASFVIGAMTQFAEWYPADDRWYKPRNQKKVI